MILVLSRNQKGPGGHHLDWNKFNLGLTIRLGRRSRRGRDDGVGGPGGVRRLRLGNMSGSLVRGQVPVRGLWWA